MKSLWFWLIHIYKLARIYTIHSNEYTFGFLFCIFLGYISVDFTHFYQHRSWWRHQMETFSALLALCAGNSQVTQRLGRFFFLSAPWINRWVNHRKAGDLGRHRAQYGVIVMASPAPRQSYKYVYCLGYSISALMVIYIAASLQYNDNSWNIWSVDSILIWSAATSLLFEWVLLAVCKYPDRSQYVTSHFSGLVHAQLSALMDILTARCRYWPRMGNATDWWYCSGLME